MISRMHFLIATRNAHKVAEIGAVLGVDHIFHTLRDCVDAPDVVENGKTFRDNAAIKAKALAGWLSSRSSQGTAVLAGVTSRTPLHVLADDSGLEVDLLNGAPGVFSARFANLDTGIPGNSPDRDNNAKLLKALDGVPIERRTARFRCVVALLESQGNAEGAMTTPIHFFEGVCEGRIGFEPHGQHGFGYDPLFIPTDYAQTFAELGEETKNKISHRAHALERLKEFLMREHPRR